MLARWQRGFASLAVATVLQTCGVQHASAMPPGGLPTAHRFGYADGYRGWPVAPRHRQHPIRGGFLDPRLPQRVYHWGVDVSVRDDRPERGAPPGRTHRVYAVEGGVVYGRRAIGRCGVRFLAIAHFEYWHVDPVVVRGQRVRAGQMVGWTCEGLWHVHLGEHTWFQGRRITVNPLHRGGKVGPYADSARPIVEEIAVYAPAFAPDQGRRLAPDRVRGIVDVRARVRDPQSFRGWMTGRLRVLQPDHHPYEVRARLTRVADRRTWAWTVFRTDAKLDEYAPALGLPIPYAYHFAPGTRGKLKTPDCLRAVAAGRRSECNGSYNFRLFASSQGAFWDTRAFRNGRYRMTVIARDRAGNTARASAALTVSN